MRWLVALGWANEDGARQSPDAQTHRGFCYLPSQTRLFRALEANPRCMIRSLSMVSTSPEWYCRFTLLMTLKSLQKILMG